jgi:hypothetical protein
MAHPEYLYWFALAFFGVPAIVLARAVVPALAIMVVAINAIAWRIGLTWQGEGVLLALLYTSALATMVATRLRMGAAETYAASLWAPMAGAAIAQASGWPPHDTYWAIYWLAMAQTISFAAVDRWPLRAAWKLVASIRRHRGIMACPA